MSRLKSSYYDEDLKNVLYGFVLLTFIKFLNLWEVKVRKKVCDLFMWVLVVLSSVQGNYVVVFHGMIVVTFACICLIRKKIFYQVINQESDV